MIRFSVIILTFHTLSIRCFFLSSKAVGLYMVMTGTSTFAEFIFNKAQSMHLLHTK